MDIFNIFELRHCYRGGDFENTPIPREDLRKIVQAGLQAPSGKNAQTTTFVIVDDPGVIGEVAKIHPIPVINTAKALIACVIDKDPKNIFLDMNFVIEDCSAAVENMFLAITALGYGTVWIDGAIRIENRNKAIDEILKIPENKTVRVLLPVGVPKEKGSPPKKLPFEKRVFFNEHQI